ncbi:hypothetical protein CPB83DRAFT_901138 [Crepidotus variabilis]|uniref:BRCT domain-containing protein n=1 Tax=Crepidotus variabilis TaxID=179855 RepID=A0A9P6JWB1_9AGAR|nr:hypothetical protein CPB83DRAFT_901138 [Crepidotus variabilis]
MSGQFEQSMDAPAPSQTQRGSKTTIFSNVDGTPMRVFAQADLPGRSKLSRELRANGAEIAHDLTLAQIILVDAESDQGRQFIRNWGQDINKTVLRYSWARKSIEAGKPLLDGDNWGGCVTQDDGAPIEEGGEEDGEPRNPLPTPRVTPVEVPRKSTQPKRQASRQPSLSAHHQPESSATPTVISAPPTAANMGLPTPMSNSQVSTPTIPPMVGGINPFMLMQNMANMNVANPAMQNPAMQNTNMANMAMNPFIANALMMMMTQMQMPNGIPMNQESLTLSFQDALRNYSGNPSLPTLPQNEVQNGITTQQPPLPFPNMEPARRFSLPSSTPGPGFLSPPHYDSSSSDEALHSISRRAKGKQKASSPSSKRRKVSGPSLKSLTAPPTYAMGPPISSRKILTKRGQPLSFYVQVECHNRMALVNEIKKNGGRIETEVAIADFVVLTQGAAKAQKVFKDLLAASIAAGRPAVQTKFIHESVEKGRLLDPVAYMFEPGLHKKRKRSMSTASVESEDPMEDEQERQRLAKMAERRKQKLLAKEEEKRRERMAVKAKEVKLVTKAKPGRQKVSKQVIPGARPGGERTPSPPPESDKQLTGMGFKFTDAEDQFARKYAKILIDRDHTITRTAVAAAICDKLPHHPKLSWMSHLTPLLTEYDEWRKRSGIAYRKAEAQAKAKAAAKAAERSQVEEPLLPVSASVPRYFSSEPATLVDTTPSDWEDDINTVVQFFVDGNDDNPDEEESLVWQRLSQKAHCKTESSWEEFYEKWATDVVERYNVARELNP